MPIARGKTVFCVELLFIKHLTLFLISRRHSLKLEEAIFFDLLFQPFLAPWTGVNLPPLLGLYSLFSLLLPPLHLMALSPGCKETPFAFRIVRFGQGDLSICFYFSLPLLSLGFGFGCTGIFFSSVAIGMFPPRFLSWRSHLT